MLRLFSYRQSGNAYKVRLLLKQLAIDHSIVEIDILSSSGRPAEFLKKHPTGQVPLLELEDGRCLGESGAILEYLAAGTRLLPSDRFERAETLSWMFFEQNQIEPTIATSRFWLAIRKDPEARKQQLPLWHALGSRALEIMEQRLQDREFFAAGRYTIADIALYGYTHVAAEGGFDLGTLPRVGAWLERVRTQPGHVPM